MSNSEQMSTMHSLKKKFRSKYEQLIYGILRQIYPYYRVFTNMSLKEFDNCPSRLRRSSVDLYIPELRLAIEIQGEHHYRPVNYGDKAKAQASFERKVKTDNLKRDFLFEHGVKLLTIDTELLDNLGTEEQIMDYLKNAINSAFQDN